MGVEGMLASCEAAHLAHRFEIVERAHAAAIITLDCTWVRKAKQHRRAGGSAWLLYSGHGLLLLPRTWRCAQFGSGVFKHDCDFAH